MIKISMISQRKSCIKKIRANGNRSGYTVKIIICIFVLIFLFISNLAIYYIIGTRYNSNWDVEIAQSSEQAWEGSPIGLTPDGNPIIEYQSQFGILVAWRSRNHVWQHENIGCSTDPFMESSMVVDNTGIIHLVYLSGGFHQLVYAKKDGGAWERQTSEDANYRSTSLAVDKNCNPHIIYSKSRHLNYTHWDNGNWTTVTIDTPTTNESSKIVVDNSNFPHILSPDVSKKELKYFHWNGSNSSKEVLDCRSFLVSNPDLCIDSKGSPHIVFVDEPNTSLKYIEKTGYEWNIETVDATGVKYQPAIAIDKNDEVHIAYNDNGLKYAKKVHDTWSIETIDSSKKAGRCPSITTDKTGNVYIAYIDRNTYNLNYATTNKSGAFRTYPIAVTDYTIFIAVSVLIVTISLVSSNRLLIWRQKKTKDEKGPPRKIPVSLRKWLEHAKI